MDNNIPPSVVRQPPLPPAARLIKGSLKSEPEIFNLTGLKMSTSSLVAESVWQAIESTRLVTDDQLSILHFMYGKNFEKAMRIFDERGVKRISGEPSGRSIFQVVGESRRKEVYMCFAEHYCACYSFFYDIINRGEELCCKHQLAARLAASTGSCIDVRVSDEELALLLSKI